MHRRHFAASILVVLLNWSEGAQATNPVNASANGGLWCRDPSEISATLAGKFKDAPDRIGPSCGTIAPHERISPTQLRDMVGGVRAGKGNTEDAVDVEFVLHAGPSREFKRVAIDDIRAAPKRWAGHDIEISDAHVYWVTSGDVRIIKPGSDVVIMAKKIRISDDAGHFGDECETIAASVTSTCRAIVRFSYSAFDTDNPTGTRIRLVIIPNDVDLIKPRRRR